MIYRFLLSFIFGAILILALSSLSACGGGESPDLPDYCQDQETFIGPQLEECTK